MAGADDDTDFRYLEAFSDAYGSIEEQLGSSFSDYTTREGGCYIDNAFLTMQPSTSSSTLLRSASASATVAASTTLPMASSSSRSSGGAAAKRGQQSGKSTASEKQSGSTRTKRKKDGWDDAADELGEDRVTRHNNAANQQQQHHHHAKVGGTNSGAMSVAVGNVFQEVPEIASGGGGGSGKANQVLTAKELKRERNKVLARKTRVKKKVELEALRDQACMLRAENERLKEILRGKLPSRVVNDIMVKCTQGVTAEVGHMMEDAHNKYEAFFALLKSAQRTYCIASATAPDQPLVYASPCFVELTGYSIQEILGRNCRFLQGPGTDLNEVAKLKRGIMNNEEVQAKILNYKRDGTPFMNLVQLAPMRDKTGKVVLIIGVQCCISDLATSKSTSGFTSGAWSDDGMVSQSSSSGRTDHAASSDSGSSSSRREGGGGSDSGNGSGGCSDHLGSDHNEDGMEGEDGGGVDD